jgi:hypothetical protein
VKQEAWVKNKFTNVFAKKGRFEKADVTRQNAEYTLTANTLVNIVTRNIKNTVKNQPWSALYGRVTRGSQSCTRVPTRTCQSQPQPP